MTKIDGGRIEREEMKFDEGKEYEVEDYMFRLEYFVWEVGFLSDFEPHRLTWEMVVFVRRALQLLAWAESLPAGCRIGYEKDDKGIPRVVLKEEGTR